MEGLIKFGRNDKCPCGSEKKYKNCCMNTSDFIGYNYENKPILINKEFTEKIINSLFSYINTHTLDNGRAKKLDINESILVVKELNKLFDSFIAEIALYAPCKKGCNTCCNQLVEVHPIEAEIIRRFVISEFSKEQIMQLNIKNNAELHLVPTYSKLLTNDELKHDYYQKNIPCTFLSDNGECLIYDVRPLACRKHIVFNHSSVCKPVNKELRYHGSVIDIMDRAMNLLSGIVYGSEYQLLSRDGNLYFLIKPMQYWFNYGFESINLKDKY